MTPMKLYLPDTTGLMNSQRLADAQDPHRQSHKTEKGKWTLDLIPANMLSATENHWQRKTVFYHGVSLDILTYAREGRLQTQK